MSKFATSIGCFFTKYAKFVGDWENKERTGRMFINDDEVITFRVNEDNWRIHFVVANTGGEGYKSYAINRDEFGTANTGRDEFRITFVEDVTAAELDRLNHELWEWD